MTTPSMGDSDRVLSRCPRGALLLGIALLALAGGHARPTHTARAFDLDSHEAILRAALTTAMSGDALDEVTNYGIGVPGSNEPELSNLTLAPGAALHGLTFEQLWDNAPTPDVICGRMATITGVLQYAVDQAAPMGTAYKELTDGKKARRAFGLAAVLLSNFYAHSNWVELAADQGSMPTAAPLAACVPGNLPAGLQTGYYAAGSAPDGCPTSGGTAKPPAPYKYCFSQLSKDSGDAGHGAEHATKLAGQPTYYQLAKQLAIGATKQLFTALHGLVVQTYTPESWNADGQCVFDKLTKSNADPSDLFATSNVVFNADASCLDLSGVWLVDPDGDIVTIEQDRSLANDQLHLYAYYAASGDGADCVFGSTRSYFFDAMLDGVQITGTTAQCRTSENVVTYCSRPSLYEIPFAGTLDGTGRARTISATFTNYGYALHYDDNGDIVSCEPYAPFDEVYDFSLTRQPAAAP